MRLYLGRHANLTQAIQEGAKEKTMKARVKSKTRGDTSIPLYTVKLSQMTEYEMKALRHLIADPKNEHQDQVAETISTELLKVGF